MITENKLLQLLYEENAYETINEETDVTRRMLAEVLGVSDHAATDMLEKKVSSGICKKIKVRLKSGQVVIAYRYIAK